MKEVREKRYHIAEKLIKAQDNYINLLNAELSEVSGIAYAHGWRSSRITLGESARNDICDLLKQFKDLK